MVMSMNFYVGRQVVGGVDILHTALSTAPYLGSYSLNKEFWSKTSLFQKSIESFHNKVEKSV